MIFHISQLSFPGARSYFSSWLKSFFTDRIPLIWAYRKSGIREPSGTLARPYKNRKTGTLVGSYKNRENGTLAGPYKKRKTGTLGRQYKNRKTRTPVRPFRNRTRDPSVILEKLENRNPIIIIIIIVFYHHHFVFF